MTATTTSLGYSLFLSALIFIALILGFLYMVYGKEEENPEEEK